jgi:hypothetical protein
MKKLNEFMNGLKLKIKKNFFILIITLFSQDNKPQQYLYSLNEKEQEEFVAEDYMTHYITTTRWQTL